VILADMPSKVEKKENHQNEERFSGIIRENKI